MMSPAPAAPQPFTLRQRLDAAPSRVFRAWTEPEQIARWFVPVDGWSAPIDAISVDARPGGAMRLSWIDDTGEAYPVVFHYREVEEPNRLVFTTGAPDQDPNDPGIAVATVTLEERDGVTEMTYEGLSQDPDQQEVEGWTAMFERLAGQLASG